MTSVVDKIAGTDISGKKKMARVTDQQNKALAGQRAEQAKIQLQQKKESEAIQSQEARRLASSKKVRGGTAGRRSLMSGGFKGVQDKKATLG